MRCVYSYSVFIIKLILVWFCVTSVLLSTTDRKVLVLLCVALGAFLATVEARRGDYLPTSPKPISCDSVLVKLNPSAYPHCCSPGPWRFVKQESASKCPSGKRYVLTRTKCPGMNGIKTVCE